MLYTYDPSEVSVVLGGKIITGYGDGTFVKFGRRADMWAMKVGVSGEGTRAKSNDKSGMIEITLMNSSPSNDVLSALAAADELSNSGAVPGMIKDNSGRDLATCLTCWIKKYPDREKAKEANTTTWQLETDELVIFIGGN